MEGEEWEMGDGEGGEEDGRGVGEGRKRRKGSRGSGYRSGRKVIGCLMNFC